MLKKWMLAVLSLGLFSTPAWAADGARVVVLKWPGSDMSYEDGDLQRVVKSRIARADAVRPVLPKAVMTVLYWGRELCAISRLAG